MENGRILGILLLTIGVLLLVFGVDAIQAVSSDFSRSFQGTPRRTALRNEQGLRRRVGDH